MYESTKGRKKLIYLFILTTFWTKIFLQLSLSHFYCNSVAPLYANYIQIRLIIVMLSVVILNVVMPSVVASLYSHHFQIRFINSMYESTKGRIKLIYLFILTTFRMKILLQLSLSHFYCNIIAPLYANYIQIRLNTVMLSDVILNVGMWSVVASLYLHYFQ